MADATLAAAAAAVDSKEGDEVIPAVFSTPSGMKKLANYLR